MYLSTHTTIDLLLRRTLVLIFRYCTNDLVTILILLSMLQLHYKQ